MKSTGLSCREFFGYLSYRTPTFETHLLPQAAQEHLESCRACRKKMAQLKAALKLLRKAESKRIRQAKKSATAVYKHACRFAKRKGLALPEKVKVDCQTVRQYLPLAADPLGEMFPSLWMSEHLGQCLDCELEYWRVSEFRNILFTAERLAAGADIAIDDVFTAPKPSVIRRIYRLAGSDPRDTNCEQVEPYYHSMAVCDLEGLAPDEIYLHARNCDICRSRVIQLRSKLNVGILEDPGKTND